MEKDVLYQILKSPSSVLSFREIAMTVGPISHDLLKRRLHYYAQKGWLYPVRKGFYAKDKNYNRRELANKIFTPSYISFETVLLEAGVTFQYYSTIFAATYQTRDITCDGQGYSYKKIKNILIVDPAGVENRDTYFIASPERAFLDVLYLNKNYYFDNLSALNFDKVFSILPIYKNKRMEKVVHKKYKIFKEDFLYEEELKKSCSCNFSMKLQAIK